eukprot:m.34486 g.34486  ORF g.34486 m.34486 type:complete len:52 (+) comp7319_c0_seq2:1602-1757(+)
MMVSLQTLGLYCMIFFHQKRLCGQRNGVLSSEEMNEVGSLATCLKLPVITS